MSVKFVQQLILRYFQMVGADGMGTKGKQPYIPLRLAPTLLKFEVNAAILTAMIKLKASDFVPTIALILVC